jgi:hypothetical protein
MSLMDLPGRRAFCIGAARTSLAALTSSFGCAHRGTAPAVRAADGVLPPAGAPRFDTDASALAARWAAALEGLARNVVALDRHPDPVLIEGEGYPGIWLECGPLEALVYRGFAPARGRSVAAASHRIFFALQRPDGQLPCYVWDRKHHDKVGFGQIQMVVPIAATALEVAEADGDEALLTEAYAACARWDAWLSAHRNTRGTGLCEAFCGYDTGHDNSPRFDGVPWQCPDGEAARLPPAPRAPHRVPYLAPDLSASVHGGRVALARMARHLGKPAEEARWLEAAATIRATLLRRCLDPDDICFYDVDADERFVRIKSDVLTRVCGEHVPDQALFDEVWRRHLHDPRAFWAPFPFPSVALDDPRFDRAIPENSWGSASQALTALRAPRWMGHYGKHAGLAHLMGRWLQALTAAPEFMQQLDPRTGQMSTSRQYSPAMLVLLDFVARLHGVRRDGDTLVWSFHLPPGATRCRYALGTARGEAVLAQTTAGATLSLDGRTVATVVGAAGLVTDLDGRLRALVGTAAGATTIALTGPDGVPRRVSIAPDQVVPLA